MAHGRWGMGGERERGMGDVRIRREVFSTHHHPTCVKAFIHHHARIASRAGESGFWTHARRTACTWRNLDGVHIQTKVPCARTVTRAEDAQR